MDEYDCTPTDAWNHVTIAPPTLAERVMWLLDDNLRWLGWALILWLLL